MGIRYVRTQFILLFIVTMVCVGILFTSFMTKIDEYKSAIELLKGVGEVSDSNLELQELGTDVIFKHQAKEEVEIANLTDRLIALDTKIRRIIAPYYAKLGLHLVDKSAIYTESYNLLTEFVTRSDAYEHTAQSF